ncbi:MAG: methionine adenosyltransferase [candidate division WOR-3 bacterium]|nr:MAG: methionine adenosyltransferase [candidate division WOR-3 bacterium]
MARTRFTSESVTEGHPDKVCDQISDAVLDEVLRQDRRSRVACETYATVGLILVGGEITTKGWVNLNEVVRGILRDIGYTDAHSGMDADSCSILDAIGRQSPDIAQGVDTGGAGDQGVMFGFATRETREFMPLPIMLAHMLAKRLAEVRRSRTLRFLRPDGKSQVTVEYESGRPVRVDNVVIAAQHDETVLDRSGRQMNRKARRDIEEVVVRKVVPPRLIDRNTRIYINQTGKFCIGGPQSDTGMTGRKIIVDTYGGAIQHGGGAFSGKDPSKVDRSATYMARYIAKNCVAARLCDRMVVRLAYVIGRAEPIDVTVNTHGTGITDDEELVRVVRRLFPLKPTGMIRHLKLLNPIYRPTASYGHFGRRPVAAGSTRPAELFTWERLDMVRRLQAEVK